MALAKTEKIWMNGRLIPWDQANVHVMSHVVHYGSCIFEGIRCYKTPGGSAVFRLDRHIARMFDGCRIYRMEIPYTPDQLQDAVLETIGLTAFCERRAGVLSHGQKQWLEIGMLPVQEPQLLLVDEPVAGMTQQETERTAELLVSLSGNHSVVVVEHDMEFVRSLARRVTVLHEGTVLAEGTMDAIQQDPRVMEVYLGS